MRALNHNAAPIASGEGHDHSDDAPKGHDPESCHAHGRSAHWKSEESQYQVAHGKVRREFGQPELAGCSSRAREEDEQEEDHADGRTGGVNVRDEELIAMPSAVNTNMPTSTVSRTPNVGRPMDGESETTDRKEDHHLRRAMIMELKKMAAIRIHVGTG